MFSTYIQSEDTKQLKRLIENFGRGNVLDVGCGGGRIKKWLPIGAHYTGMDAVEGLGVDVAGDVHDLPFEDAVFDTVLCTSVLEHVSDERRVVSEMYRVLKPGGRVIVTIPFVHHYHRDPEDYRRLTHVGLEKLLREQGFSSVQIYRNNGVYATVEYAFFCVFVNARKEGLLAKWYLWPHFVLSVIMWLGFRLLSYVMMPWQKYDTSLYVGVAAVAKK